MKTTDSQLTIESGVEIPRKRLMGGKRRSIIWDMQQGDSILFPEGVDRQNVWASTYLARREGRKFTTRVVENNQVRLWRTE